MPSQDTTAAPAGRADAETSQSGYTAALTAFPNDVATGAHAASLAGTARRVLRLLRRGWRLLRKQRHHRAARVRLDSMTERELLDIGITRGEIDCIAARRAVGRLRDDATRRWLF